MFNVQGSTSKVRTPDLICGSETGTRNSKLETRNSERGFTIVEIVVTLMIIGILAAIVMPRFVGSSAFKSRAFYDEAQAVVHYAHKTAIAWRGTPVYVCVTATTVSARRDSCSGSILPHPLTGNPLTATAPSGVTLTPTTLSFDGGGRPNPNAQATITITRGIAGDPARQIVVEAETGYAHP